MTAAARPPERAPERAQVVWQRALELAGPRAVHDRFNNALELLRAAHHDPATMAHALTLGRTHLRGDRNDGAALIAADILESAIAFLGVKPRAGDDTHQPKARKAQRSPRERSPDAGSGDPRC